MALAAGMMARPVGRATEGSAAARVPEGTGRRDWHRARRRRETSRRAAGDPRTAATIRRRAAIPEHFP